MAQMINFLNLDFCKSPSLWYHWSYNWHANLSTNRDVARPLFTRVYNVMLLQMGQLLKCSIAYLAYVLALSYGRKKKTYRESRTRLPHTGLYESSLKIGISQEDLKTKNWPVGSLSIPILKITEYWMTLMFLVPKAASLALTKYKRWKSRNKRQNI